MATSPSAALQQLAVITQQDFVTIISPRSKADINDLVALLRDRRDDVMALVQQHGVVLFRGFGDSTHEQLETFVTEGLAQDTWNAFNARGLPAFVASWLRGYIENLLGAGDYRRYLSRDAVRLGPTESAIQGPHVEAGSTSKRPRYLTLCCHEPAPHLGETGIVDLHRVFRELPPAQKEKYSRAWNRFCYTTNRRINFLDRLLLGMSPFRVIKRADGRADLELPLIPAVCTVPGTEDRSLQPWAFARSTNAAAHAAAVAAFPGRGELHPDSTADQMDLAWTLCDEAGKPIEWSAEEQRDLFDRIYSQALLLEWQKGDIALVDNVRMGHWRMNGEQGNRKLVQIQTGMFDVLQQRQATATANAPVCA